VVLRFLVGGFGYAQYLWSLNFVLIPRLIAVLAFPMLKYKNSLKVYSRYRYMYTGTYFILL
jgi:hypothetical protein